MYCNYSSESGARLCLCRPEEWIVHAFPVIFACIRPADGRPVRHSLWERAKFSLGSIRSQIIVGALEINVYL